MHTVFTEQAAHAAQAGLLNPLGASLHQIGFHRLHNALAAANHLVVVSEGFPLADLAGTPNEAMREFLRHQGPVYYAGHDGRPAAISFETWPNKADLDRVHALAAAAGLVVHKPRIPAASFWHPGASRLFLLTRPDFGTVVWLKGQFPEVSV